MSNSISQVSLNASNSSIKKDRPRDIISNVKILKQGQQLVVNKLQLRAEEQIQLLDQIKEFHRKKHELDVEYGKSLEKLSRTFLTKIPNAEER